MTRHYRIGHGRVLRAVDGVDMAIGRGTTLGLVGESGSGKSTLGRTLVGLQTPYARLGRFRWPGCRGRPGSRRLAALRQQRQIVFQDPSGALNPRMTIGDTRRRTFAGAGLDARGRASRGAGGIWSRRAFRASFFRAIPHEISGGQRQRAVIARAISTDPAFIVADEPVSALDVSTRAQIINFLRELQQTRGMTMLFISHDLSVVAHMCRKSPSCISAASSNWRRAKHCSGRRLHPYTVALLSAIPLPDPARERTRRRIALMGETPDPAAIPSGCRFHTRCLRATDLCRHSDPPCAKQPRITALRVTIRSSIPRHASASSGADVRPRPSASRSVATPAVPARRR